MRYAQTALEPRVADVTFGPLGKYEPVNDNDPKKGVAFNRHELRASLTRDLGRPPSTDSGQPERHGDFMQTYTGRKFWSLDPRPEEVFIEDIAHSLSLQCRYAGHCIKFLSVAEHSVLIARWLLDHTDAQTALYGLLHDAPEAYVVDVPRPLKPFLANYKEAEAKVWAAIARRYRLAVAMPEAVHEADGRIIADELVNLLPMDWHSRHDDPLGVKLEYWSPEEAEVEFLAAFDALTAMAGETGMVA